MANAAKKPRCQPTPLATSIHRGLSSSPFLPPSFLLSLHSPSRIYEPKSSTFHCITSHRDIEQNMFNSPPFRSSWLVVVPEEKHVFCPPCLTVAELLVSWLQAERRGGQINMTMIDSVLTRLAGCSTDRWSWEKRQLDANLIKASMKN